MIQQIQPKKLKRIPAIAKPRFLTGLLKLVVHGDLTKSEVFKLSDLFEIIDYKYYQKDTDLYTLLRTVELVINSIIGNVTDMDLIITRVEESIRDEDNKDYVDDVIEPLMVTKCDQSPEEVSYLLKTVGQYAKMAFLMDYKDKFTNNFDAMAAGGAGRPLELVIKELETDVGELNIKLNKALNGDELDAGVTVFMNSKEFIDHQFKQVYELSKRPSRVLKMGIQKFNEMLSEAGGLLTGKFYLFNAPINSFKTGLLLYMAKWIQLYNSDSYKVMVEKVKKKPIALVVSLENTWDENSQRFYAMYSGKDLDKTESLDSARSEWLSNYYATDSNIEICLVYAKSNVFSAMDLENKIDAIEAQGYVVIATILDFLKNMKDDHNNVDPRQKVISIAKSLHEISARRSHMVMVSAHHTNRAGDELMDDITSRGGVDKVKHLGRQHLTEANAVEEPVDYSAYITPEVSQLDGKSYLTFSQGKCRYKNTDVTYFAHYLREGFFIKDDFLEEKSESIDSITDTAPDQVGGGMNGNPVYSDQIETKPIQVKNSAREQPKRVPSSKPKSFS